MGQPQKKLDDEPESTPAPKEERFKIVNTVRGRHNRIQRMLHPAHARLKQQLGAGKHRVLRARPLIMTASQIEEHINEIHMKAMDGVIEVQTIDGRRIDPKLLVRKPTAADAPPPPPVVPVPHKPLDSANRDKNFGIGENIPQVPGGIPLAQVTPGNNTTGGIPGPLENEGKKDPAAPPVGEKDPTEKSDVPMPDDPAAGDPASDDPAAG